MHPNRRRAILVVHSQVEIDNHLPIAFALQEAFPHIEIDILLINVQKYVYVSEFNRVNLQKFNLISLSTKTKNPLKKLLFETKVHSLLPKANFFSKSIAFN